MTLNRFSAYRWSDGSIVSLFSKLFDKMRTRFLLHEIIRKFINNVITIKQSIDRINVCIAHFGALKRCFTLKFCDSYISTSFTWNATKFTIQNIFYEKHPSFSLLKYSLLGKCNCNLVIAENLDIAASHQFQIHKFY